MALTQEEMEQMPKAIEQAFSDLELKILEDIVARIKQNNMITATAEYDIFQLIKMGESERMIKRYVEKTLNLTYSETEKIFGDVFETGYNRDSSLYAASGADFIAYKDNKELQQFIGAIKEQTKGTYKNITNTMGFVRQREGVKTWVPLTKYYKDTLSRAVFEITSGAFSYSKVIKRTINEMTNSGLRTIDYASGRTSRIEVAARRAIMTAVTQVTAKVTEQNMEKLHTDYVEVSWHETARPTHQVWQGRVFKWNRNNDADNKIQNMEKQSISVARRKQAQSLRKDSKYQDTIRQRKEEWKKRHSEFDKATAKTEINNIKSQIADMQKQINASLEKEKPLEKKVYIDGTGTDEDMIILRQSATERKKMQEQVEVLNGDMLDKQELYKNEAQNRIIKAGTIEEIKLSKKMTPDTVDALEDALTKLKDKYGIMPKGVVYNPSKVPDATVTYNWLDDKIYISNRFNDINNYADIVKKSEDSLIEYREKSGIVKIQKERLKNAEKILSDKNIKGYEREKAVINKAEAEIELNTQRMAVRENLMDTLTHEYGHFIHRHANADYVQKSSVFGAKDLGGKLINGDWKYDINSHYSANAKIEAAKISKYATESPYEAFAEGFLAKEKGQEIPESIEKVIKEAKVKAGVKNVANGQKNSILGSTKDERILDVHPIGKINKEIYKCITDDILTDEVVITNNQIQHIMDRHPNDYERFSSYFGEIVKNPDYIIEANKPNTALLLKEIKENDEIFKTVLRLVTSKDNPNYKNSIITFMKIDEKEWNRLLRNKTILYKKE
jgi:hypothetical protein